MDNIDPYCPPNYTLNKNNCRCIKLNKSSRNTKKTTRIKLTKKVINVDSNKPTTKKRCPNGTRRNKITKICEPKNTTN